MAVLTAGLCSGLCLVALLNDLALVHMRKFLFSLFSPFLLLEVHKLRNISCSKSRVFINFIYNPAFSISCWESRIANNSPFFLPPVATIP